MDASKVLNVSTYAARIILENGGETYRVEDTVCKICESYGFSAECFATITGIMASIKEKDGKIISIVVRISKRGTNLDKIHMVNSLTRATHDHTPESLMSQLKSIENRSKYPAYLIFFAYAICAASFSIIFGGSYMDFLGAFLTGALLNLSTNFLKKIQMNIFIIYSLGGAICATMGILMFWIDLIDNLDTVIISSLMLMVPGVALTNSIRDIISGDLMAGIARGVEALLIATSLAIGTGAVLSVLL